MRVAIITHVEHISRDNKFFGYSPYIKEMNLWLKYVDSVEVVSPLKNENITAIHSAYKHSDLTIRSVSEFSLTSFLEVFKTLKKSPSIAVQIYKAMYNADHIHLRCPGNMGLLGCIVQIAFPSKPKTAKYAGNWDPKSIQPWTYRLQKWILGNTFLTKNMQVLVYGEWENQSVNIKPFFTATYTEADKEIIDFTQDKRLEELENGVIRFLFVGTLSEGKRPLYAVQLAEQLYKNGHKVQLELFGEGKERETLVDYIERNQLAEIVTLKGNQTAETVKEAYRKSHFLVLPSKSEGWPKVVAEAMFWGCLPIATPISCVPNMLNEQQRGMLLSLDLQKDLGKIEMLIGRTEDFKARINAAMEWSHEYTIDKFESEIKQLLEA